MKMGLIFEREGEDKMMKKVGKKMEGKKVDLKRKKEKK